MGQVIMRFSCLILFGLINLVFSAASADDQFSKITVDGHIGYIVPKKIAPKQMEWTDGAVDLTKITGYWTPSLEEVLGANANIRLFIHSSARDVTVAFPTAGHSEKYKRNAANEIQLVERHLNHYTIQFVGIVTGGEKRIYCNYFDLGSVPDFNLDPLTRLIVVDDGGYYFWQIEYEPVSKACLNLQINGPWEMDR